MSHGIDASARAEWRANWPVAASGFFGVALGAVPTYSLGLMLAPIEQEFGWGRAEISSGLLVVSVATVLLSPFLGMVIDKVGPRRIAIIGVILFCVSLALISRATQNIWSWWLLWALVAIAAIFIQPTVWVAGVSSLFSTSRGLAIAAVVSGTGLASFATPLATFHLIENFGWRTAYIGLACVWGIIIIPLVFFCFSSASDQHRNAKDSKLGQKFATLPGLTINEGLNTTTFYKLAIAGLIMATANIALIVNLVPIMVSNGMTRESAAGIAGILGISTVFGRIAGGFLLDKFNAKIVAAIGVLLPACAAAIMLIAPGSAPFAILAIVVLGLGSGAEFDSIAYLSSRHFGMRSFGFLFGTISGLLAFGLGLGPVLANHIYDLGHSYDPVLWAFLPLSAITAALLISIGEYPTFADVQKNTNAL